MKVVFSLGFGILFIGLFFSCSPASNIKIVEFEVPAKDHQTTGFTIPARLFIGNNGPSVTMFYCHGGPHAPSDEIIPLLQTLAYELKINAVSFDFRGSKIKGYKNVAKVYDDSIKASEYLQSGDRDYGGIHIDDLQRIVDGAIKRFPDLINNKKLVIAGHSFGGYLVAVAVTNPEITKRFKLGIAISGFYNLGRYASSNVFSFKDDAETQQRRAPVNFVQNISQPILIIQGDANLDKTTLVSRADTEAFANAAKAAAKDVHTLFLDTLSHKSTEESEKAWNFVRPWIEQLKTAS